MADPRWPASSTGAVLQVTLGSTHHHLGTIAAGIGRLDAAVDHFAAAYDSNLRSGLQPFAAVAAGGLAQALTARDQPGDIGRATRAARTAAAIAGRLGMRLLAEEVDGIRAGRSPLSPRQREVAELVAKGHTNRQIAEALSISERTAENHVQNILQKLQFGTRAQIATWVTQQG